MTSDTAPLLTDSDKINIYFGEDGFKSIKNEPQKNVEAFIRKLCTERSIPFEKVTLKDNFTSKTLKWNAQTTFGELQTLAIRIVEKDKDKRVGKEMVKEREKEKGKEKEREKERKEREKEMQGLPQGPMNTSSKGQEITIYFGQGEFKCIRNDPKKNVSKVLTSLAVQRNINLQDCYLIDYKTNTIIEWNQNTVFGDFDFLSFQIVDKKDFEQVKYQKLERQKSKRTETREEKERRKLEKEKKKEEQRKKKVEKKTGRTVPASSPLASVLPTVIHDTTTKPTTITTTSMTATTISATTSPGAKNPPKKGGEDTHIKLEPESTGDSDQPYKKQSDEDDTCCGCKCSCTLL